MKDITVMLPITVPDSIYCYHKELGYKCKAFGLFSGCYYGFRPNIVSEDVVEKDKDCRNLMWKENIR